MVSSPRGGAGNYGVPVSGVTASAATPPQGAEQVSVVAPAPAAPPQMVLRPAAPSTVLAHAEGTAVKKPETRVARQATATATTTALFPMGLTQTGAQTKPESTSPASSVQELAAAAVAAPSNGALQRIKKGWSAFVQKIRSFRR